MKPIKFALIILCIFMASHGLAKDKKDGKEISDHPKKISCLYMGLSEQNGETEVDLTFKNRTGKSIENLYGGFSILDEKGESIQVCGFTYSKPFPNKKEIRIPAFRYLPLKDASVRILKKHPENPPIVFRLREIVYKDGKKEVF